MNHSLKMPPVLRNEKNFYSASLNVIKNLESVGDLKHAAKLASEVIHFAMFKMMEPIDSSYVQRVLDKRSDLYCRMRIQ